MEEASPAMGAVFGAAGGAFLVVLDSTAASSFFGCAGGGGGGGGRGFTAATGWDFSISTDLSGSGVFSASFSFDRRLFRWRR